MECALRQMEGQEVAIKLSISSEKEEAKMHGCSQLKHLQGSAIARLIAAGTAANMLFLAIGTTWTITAHADVAVPHTRASGRCRCGPHAASQGGRGA